MLKLGRMKMTVFSAVTYGAAASLAGLRELDSTLFIAGWAFVFFTQLTAHFLGKMLIVETVVVRSPAASGCRYEFKFLNSKKFSVAMYTFLHCTVLYVHARLSSANSVMNMMTTFTFSHGRWMAQVYRIERSSVCSVHSLYSFE